MFAEITCYVRVDTPHTEIVICHLIERHCSFDCKLPQITDVCSCAQDGLPLAKAACPYLSGDDVDLQRLLDVRLAHFDDVRP